MSMKAYLFQSTALSVCTLYSFSASGPNDIGRSSFKVIVLWLSLPNICTGKSAENSRMNCRQIPHGESGVLVSPATAIALNDLCPSICISND